MNVELVCDPTALADLSSEWDVLSAASPSRIACAEYERMAASASGDPAMHLVVVRNSGKIATLAPFILEHGTEQFSIGERRLFRLPVRWLRLAGGGFLGDESPEAVREAFSVLERLGRFDKINLGELALDSALYRGIHQGLNRSRWTVSTPAKAPADHWVIDLPDSFEAYLGSFKKKVRQNRKREVRLMEETHGGAFACFTKADEVGRFLEAGERISRLTYQWNVGQQLRNDEATREEYRQRAAEKTLRAYLLYAGDEPCAFARGILRDRVFHYETPGFDPRYAKWSPGNVLLLKVIRDLIENTDCVLFDFGTGGDLVGYKAIFGNRTYKADVVMVHRRWQPYPVLLTQAQQGLGLVKRIGNAILGQGELKRTLKRLLRGSRVPVRGIPEAESR